jgi:hypothetical protein
MAFAYPNQRYTTFLGLSLFGMDEILADNMNLIDAAYGAGSSINVNGTFISSPNLNDSTPAAPGGKSNIKWQFDSNGNISGYASASGGSSVSVNGSTVTNPNFNGTTPAAPAGSINSVWQSDGSGNVSSYIPTPAVTIAKVSHQWLDSYTASTGAFTQSQPAFTDISGTLSLAKGGTGVDLSASGGSTFVLAQDASHVISARALVSGDIPNNAANTTGSAASLSVTGQTGLFTVVGLTSTNRAKTVRDAADTILELGGSYTPTGTWTSMTLVTPALGTPASGVLTNCTGYLWNNLANATGALTLANGTNGTELDHTSAVTIAFKNTTAATSGTSQSSPLLKQSGTYWNGAASAEDYWTIQDVVANGTNGTSTLTFTHSGSTGIAAVSAPLLELGAGTVNIPSLYMGSPANNIGFGCPGNTPQSYSNSPTNLFSFSQNGKGGGYALVQNVNSANTCLASTGITTFVGVGLVGTQTTGTTTAVGLGNNQSFTATSGSQIAVQVGFTGAGVTFAPTSGTATFAAFAVSPTINQTGGANGTVTDILVNSTETAVVGTHNLLDLQVGSASKLTVKNSGIVTNYGGTSTVSQGMPSEIAISDLTAQSAAVTATNLTASAPRTGRYRVAWSADITTAATVSSVLGGTNGFQVTYTSPTDSVAKTTVPGNSVTSAGNTTAIATGGDITIYAKTGTAISYTFDYTSAGGTAMVFEIHVLLEAM